RRRIDRHATLLPAPDSPAMPTISPRRTEKDTPLTARTTLFFRWKCVWRSSTSSSASIYLAGGPDMAPRPPALGRAPAWPWRASGLRFGCLIHRTGGPDMAPRPPALGRAPAWPWRAAGLRFGCLIHRTGGPD